MLNLQRDLDTVTKFWHKRQQLLDLMLFWKRFIDDVLGLFRGNEREFEELVKFNHAGGGKIQVKLFQEKVEFLVLIISIEEGKLKTNLFIKP